MQRDMFPPPHTHPQLQAFEAIESTHALLVHGPAVTAQQDPDAQEPEAWPRGSRVANDLPLPDSPLPTAVRVA